MHAAGLAPNAGWLALAGRAAPLRRLPTGEDARTAADGVPERSVLTDQRDGARPSGDGVEALGDADKGADAEALPRFPGKSLRGAIGGTPLVISRLPNGNFEVASGIEAGVGTSRVFEAAAFEHTKHLSHLRVKNRRGHRLDGEFQLNRAAREVGTPHRAERHVRSIFDERRHSLGHSLLNVLGRARLARNKREDDLKLGLPCRARRRSAERKIDRLAPRHLGHIGNLPVRGQDHNGGSRTECSERSGDHLGCSPRQPSYLHRARSSRHAHFPRICTTSPHPMLSSPSRRVACPSPLGVLRSAVLTVSDAQHFPPRCPSERRATMTFAQATPRSRGVALARPVAPGGPCTFPGKRAGGPDSGLPVLRGFCAYPQEFAEEAESSTQLHRLRTFSTASTASKSGVERHPNWGSDLPTQPANRGAKRPRRFARPS